MKINTNLSINFSINFHSEKALHENQNNVWQELEKEIYCNSLEIKTKEKTIEILTPDLEYLIENLCFRSVPNLLQGRQEEVYMFNIEETVHLTLVQDKVRFCYGIYLELFDKLEFLQKLLDCGKRYVKFMSNLGNTNILSKVKMQGLLYHQAKAEYALILMNNPVHVFLQIRTEQNTYYQEKEIHKNNEALQNRLRKMVIYDPRASLTISYNQQTITTTNDLGFLIHNVCFNIQKQLVNSGTYEFHSGYAPTLYFEADNTKQSLIIKDRNKNTLFPLKETFIALLECGNSYLQKLSELVDINSRMMEIINDFVPQLNKSKQVILDSLINAYKKDISAKYQ